MTAEEFADRVASVAAGLIAGGIGPGDRVGLMAAAEAAAIAYSRAAGRPGIGLRLRRAAYRRLVYTRLREALGGQVAWAISGGAPLSTDLGTSRAARESPSWRAGD